MEWERLAGGRIGVDYDVELWTIEPSIPDSVLRQVPFMLSGFIGRRYHMHHRLRSVAKDYDYLLVRHAPLDPFSLLTPEWIRRKTWYVFHTNMGELLERRYRHFGKVLNWLDLWFTRCAVGSSAGMIGVTDDILAYMRRRLNRAARKEVIYPNGIFQADWDSPLKDRRSGSLKIIFVASHFFEWNGLEVVLRSIDGERRTTESWELHLVGNLESNQIEIIEESKFSDRIVIHGVLSPPLIADLMACMDLSLGAFKLDMVGLRFASTLKVRESLGLGLPVYAGHCDKSFKDMPNCFTKGPPDWFAILAAAADSRKRTKEEVRRAARPKIDKETLLAELLKKICSLKPHK